MCRIRPGVRCSDHPRQEMGRQLVAQSQANEEIKALTERLSQGGLKKQSEKSLNSRVVLLNKKLFTLGETLKLSELEYNATPDGRRELEARIASEPDEERREELNVDLYVAKQRRQWQHETSRRFAEMETEDDGDEQVIVAAEMERDKIQAAYEKAAAKEFAARRELRRQQQMDHKMRSRAKIARARKIIYRLNQMKRLYKLMSGDIESVLKRKMRLMAKSHTKKTKTKIVKAVKEYAFAPLHDDTILNPSLRRG